MVKLAAALLCLLLLPSPVLAADTGWASTWNGPGSAANDCRYPWKDCAPRRVTSLDTGISIVVVPDTMTIPTPSSHDPKVIRTVGDFAATIMVDDLPMLASNPMSDRTMQVWTGPSVRRLTPVECERLMGWPEGWTISRRHSASVRRGRKTADPGIPSPSSSARSTVRKPQADGEPARTKPQQASSLAFPWQKPDMSEMVLTDTSPPLEAKSTMAVYSPSDSTLTATDAAATES